MLISLSYQKRTQNYLLHMYMDQKCVKIPSMENAFCSQHAISIRPFHIIIKCAYLLFTSSRYLKIYLLQEDALAEQYTLGKDMIAAE